MLRYNRIMYILFYKLPHIRTSWDYHPTFMLILGRVLRSFTHLWASSCGFRPFDPGIMLYSCNNYNLCLTASYVNIVHAIAAFSDSTFPCIGILTNSSALSVSLSVSPFPSLPIINAVGCV